MARFPHAAHTLAQQVRARYGRSDDSAAGRGTMVAASDPDGLGVVRTVKFDKTSSKWLEGVLDQIDDERITAVEKKGGQVEVTFAPSIVADRRDEFPLSDAALVASEGSGEDE